MIALQPARVVEASDLNRKVSEPVVDNMDGGIVVPENTPMRVDAVVGPSKTVSESRLAWVLKLRKVTRIQVLLAEVNVVTKVWLLP